MDSQTNHVLSALQPVPKLVVRCGDDPHPVGLSIGVHHRRPDVSVPARLFGVLLWADLFSACVLSLLDVWPGLERGWRGRCPVWELHRQAHSVLGSCGTELLSSRWIPTETLGLMVRYGTRSEVEILQRLACFQRESRRASRRFDNQKTGPSCEYHNQELLRDNHLIIEYLYLQKPSWEF